MGEFPVEIQNWQVGLYKKKVKAVTTNQYIKGGGLEKSLSQESGSHVKFLIKTKLNQKWLAPSLLHPLSYFGCWGGHGSFTGKKEGSVGAPWL